MRERIACALLAPPRKLPPEVRPIGPRSRCAISSAGWRLGPPSGQTVARAMNLTPLSDGQIIIGKAVDEPGAGDQLH
ncbi:hypothetical protein [Bradyrhizobium sp. 199]|uniref:hypothetical protein n=1 Tax=Bradyrhizobium sp. 199 TaxID=2782664 RepID=UPI001FF7F3C0|nr:hypothetical protein [Bradyrhizobium sp. 199]